MSDTEGAVRACWEVVLALDMRELRGQLPEQLLLRLLLAHHGRHLLAQVPHDEGVYLCCPHPLDKLVHLQRYQATCSCQAGDMVSAFLCHSLPCSNSLARWRADLPVACALRDIIQVLQQVGLLLLEQLYASRIQVRPHWLVCIEGSDVHFAHLRSGTPLKLEAHVDCCM